VRIVAEDIVSVFENSLRLRHIVGTQPDDLAQLRGPKVPVEQYQTHPLRGVCCPEPRQASVLLGHTHQDGRTTLFLPRGGQRVPSELPGVVSHRSRHLSGLRPRQVGWPHTVRLLVLSHLRELAYRIFRRLGSQKVLVRRRNRLLTHSEEEVAIKVIAQTLATPILSPGGTGGKHRNA